MSSPSDRKRNYPVKRIRNFIEGQSDPNSLSASDMNQIVDSLNALLNVKVLRGPAFAAYVTDSNFVLEVPGGTAESDTGAGMVYKGEWSNATDYAVGDVVIKTTAGPLNDRRLAWVALLASGPGNGGASTPTWPDDATWECLASPNPVYQGLYDSGEAYKENDVVYTRPQTDELRLWIAVQDVAAATAPTWPEPNPLYWRLLCMTGEKYSLDVCDNGVETTLNVYGPPGQ